MYLCRMCHSSHNHPVSVFLGSTYYALLLSLVNGPYFSHYSAPAHPHFTLKLTVLITILTDIVVLTIRRAHLG